MFERVYQKTKSNEQGNFSQRTVISKIDLFTHGRKLPEDYFDSVYSIYAISWTTDL
ncbi:hypothetical protein MKX41_08620 [Paenibacillus sp. FSL R5-0475]|uniref:hypothetical protein n=1 Tax=Paenibacillus sp. FSL R5-0475 TaxID=2921643 RepID=UPI0030F6FAA3